MTSACSALFSSSHLICVEYCESTSRPPRLVSHKRLATMPWLAIDLPSITGFSGSLCHSPQFVFVRISFCRRCYCPEGRNARSMNVNIHSVFADPLNAGGSDKVNSGVIPQAFRAPIQFTRIVSSVCVVSALVTTNRAILHRACWPDHQKALHIALVRVHQFI